MPDAAQQWGRRALDFVDAVERLGAPDIIQMFEAEIKACGFHAYIMAGLPSPGASLSDLTVANGWPPEWFEIYTRENFTSWIRSLNTALRQCSRSNGPRRVMTKTAIRAPIS
jgi:hypothetical protein